MKTTILISTALALLTGLALAASPTPTPPPTTPSPVPLTAVAHPPTLLTAHSTISPGLLQANLNAVPTSAQSLLQLLTTFTPLPSGVTSDKVKTVSVIITPAGGAIVTVQYVSP